MGLCLCDSAIFVSVGMPPQLGFRRRDHERDDLLIGGGDEVMIQNGERVLGPDDRKFVLFGFGAVRRRGYGFAELVFRWSKTSKRSRAPSS